MKFPKFWAQATAEEIDERGQKQWFTKWAWSDDSREDAQQTALESARKTLQRFLRGEELSRYPYGSTSAIREEVIENLTDENGDVTAAITQNAYGSLVLNASQVMFVDIDFPFVTLADVGRSFLAKLFKGDRTPPEVKHEAAALERLKAFHDQHRAWGLRVYRTAAGLRVLVTHALFQPNTKETRQLLTEFGSDPLYMRLCEQQECFRARLTPKPWRCGHYADSGRWPYLDESLRLSHDRWQAEYEQKQAGYATCRFVETLGRKEIHPKVQTLLTLHDRFTRCDSPLPLA
jgi:hypothetical protein